MPEERLSKLGDFIKSQRHLAELSLRQLAEKAKVSNPYLSQIERGLYKPSADILRAIGGALGISSEVLYTQAGLLDPSKIRLLRPRSRKPYAWIRTWTPSRKRPSFGSTGASWA